MEANKRPLKRLPQVTLWELRRHTVTIKNPLAWDKTGSDKPIQRDLTDLSELNLHRAGEGSKPIFDRNDILVNQDGMEERTMKIDRSRRSRSSSSSSSSNNTSESNSAKSWSKSIPGIRNRYPKPLRFTCEKNTTRKSPDLHKDRKLSDDQTSKKRKRDRRSRSPYRKQSVSPYRKEYENNTRLSDRTRRNSPPRTLGSPSTSRRSPPKHYAGYRSSRSPARSRSDVHSRLGKSPGRSEKSYLRTERSPYKLGRSPGKSREYRRSRSPSASSRTRRGSPVSNRSPSRSSSRYAEYVKGRRSPIKRRREYSPHRDDRETVMQPGSNPGQLPPIDYTHLAHVITQMYPRQPFVAPHMIPQPPEFYPHYGVPSPQFLPRPRHTIRPPIIYNNRAIKIFKPTETTSGTSVTATVTSSSNEQQQEKSALTSSTHQDAVQDKTESNGKSVE